MGRDHLLGMRNHPAVIAELEASPRLYARSQPRIPEALSVRILRLESDKAATLVHELEQSTQQATKASPTSTPRMVELHEAVRATFVSVEVGLKRFAEEVSAAVAAVRALREVGPIGEPGAIGPYGLMQQPSPDIDDNAQDEFVLREHEFPMLIGMRGGCQCAVVRPPCSACTTPATPEEMEEIRRQREIFGD